MDRHLILLLLFALTMETSLLLRHLGMFGGQTSSSSHQAVAGQVVQSKKSLKRRALSSLIWEDVPQQELVYFHDSILTLSQSSASLKLFGDTELELSENTLVTIEPPENEVSGQIRLRFLKGDMRARNPFASATITGQAWELSLDKASEVRTRQTGENQFEVYLVKGEALLRTQSGSQALRENERKVLKAGQVESIQVDQDLRFTMPVKERIYSHDNRTKLQLTWTAPVKQILWHQLGREERRIDIAGLQSLDLELPFGKHQFYLLNDSVSSPPLDVEVWAAPVIHLLRPLPRNRVRVQEHIDFGWTRNSDVEKYVWKAKSTGQDRLFEASTTGAATKQIFDKVDDLNWFVIGIDRDGFEIPAAYRYPLFVREDPLSAPQLKPPSVRRTKSAKPTEGASIFRKLWQVIVPEADAETATLAATFEWEPVANADHYVLEISEREDFRELVLLRKVKRARYTWRGFHEKRYYWRVAAETSHGRLGEFSAPAEFDPRQGQIVAPPLTAASNEHAAVLPAPAEKVESAGPVESGAPGLPTSDHVEPELEKLKPAWLAWRPGYSHMSLREDGEPSAKINGFATRSLMFELPFRVTRKSTWAASGIISALEVKPEPQQAYPLQGNLNLLNYRLAVTSEQLHLGLVTRGDSQTRRESVETVRIIRHSATGLQLALNREILNGQMQLQSALLYGREITVDSVLTWRQRWLLQSEYGFGVETSYGIKSQSWTASGFFLLGFGF
jgi:hypothetical protein